MQKNLVVKYRCYIFVSTKHLKNGIMSKAAEKRERQLRERLTSLLSRTLIDFQDRYLGAYVDWSIAQIEKELADNIKMHGTPYGHGRTGNWDRSHYIKTFEAELSRKNILTHRFITEAKKGYDAKFSNLIEKLIQFGMQIPHLKVEQVNNAGSELSFLITNDEMEVHARAIFVCGAIKAPHYRFITTKRNK